MSIQFQFEISKNFLNNDLTVIKEINSGYYNITHSRNIIHELRISKNPDIKTKEPHNWFYLNDSMAIVELLKKYTNDDKLMFTLGEEVENQYRGLYVHKELYHHILHWISPTYKISMITNISKLQEKYNAM